MTLKDRAFIKELLIKLDISIEAEHENASSQGLMLIFDFTAEKRKADMLKALNILSEDLPQYGKFKDANELYKAYLKLEKAYTKSQQQLKEEQSNSNKIAIKELNDLRDKIDNGIYPLAFIDNYGDRAVDSSDLMDIIDNKLKKLRGE